MSLLGDITLVVSGFPRSGTSMMMRMLHFGGIDIVASEKFKSPTNDQDPYGAFELEGIDEIKEHGVEWTQGKAVKIVAPYIKWLPIDRPLKCIFMLRDKNEIITSLLSMRTIWEVDITETVDWARGYLAHNDVPTLFLKYKEVMRYPKTAAMQIEDFLEVPLDKEKMATAVDKNARTRLKDDPNIPHIAEQKILRIDKDEYNKIMVAVYHGPGEGADYVLGRKTDSGPGISNETKGV